MSDQKKLVAQGNLLQAHTWKGLLETQGIEVELRGEALIGGVGELPVDVQTVEIWVNVADIESAKKQLADLTLERPSWQCIHCNENNDASFEICWQCGAEVRITDEL